MSYIFQWDYFFLDMVRHSKLLKFFSFLDMDTVLLQSFLFFFPFPPECLLLLCYWDRFIFPCGYVWAVVPIYSQQVQHNQVLRDFILNGECLQTFSKIKKNGKIIALATRTFCLLSSDFRVSLPSRLQKETNCITVPLLERK